MKQIELKGKNGAGMFATVDDEDYEWLNGMRWYISTCGYARSNLYSPKDKKCRNVYMHKMLLKASPENQVDHINRNKLDNRRSNLRVCTAIQNGGNTSFRKSNKSGYRGVCFVKESNKWRSYVGIEVLGHFQSKEEAARVRDKAALERWGALAQLNFPQQSQQ